MTFKDYSKEVEEALKHPLYRSFNGGYKKCNFSQDIEPILKVLSNQIIDEMIYNSRGWKYITDELKEYKLKFNK